MRKTGALTQISFKKAVIYNQYQYRAKANPENLLKLSKGTEVIERLGLPSSFVDIFSKP